MTTHTTKPEGWEGEAEKQTRGGTEKLSGESLGIGALIWACLTMAIRPSVSLQVSHFTTPD